jgi:nicotinamide mononucleotide transporter
VIHDLSVLLASAWHETSWIEILAAALALAYVPLAIWQRLSCWFAAFSSSALYAWVFFGAHLYMDSGLQLLFAGMAVYGFWQWQHGKGGAALAVSSWPIGRHALAALLIGAVSLLNAFLLHRYTSAAAPLIDSLVTWSSVFATFLVARKVYENWHWWVVIDSVSLCLFFTRHLYLTVLLYGLYVALSVIGMREWRRSLPAFAPAAEPAAEPGSHAPG